MKIFNERIKMDISLTGLEKSKLENTDNHRLEVP